MTNTFSLIWWFSIALISYHNYSFFARNPSTSCEPSLSFVVSLHSTRELTERWRYNIASAALVLFCFAFFGALTFVLPSIAAGLDEIRKQPDIEFPTWLSVALDSFRKIDEKHISLYIAITYISVLSKVNDSWFLKMIAGYFQRAMAAPTRIEDHSRHFADELYIKAGKSPEKIATMIKSFYNSEELRDKSFFDIDFYVKKMLLLHDNLDINKLNFDHLNEVQLRRTLRENMFCLISASIQKEGFSGIRQLRHLLQIQNVSHVSDAYRAAVLTIIASAFIFIVLAAGAPAISKVIGTSMFSELWPRTSFASTSQFFSTGVILPVCFLFVLLSKNDYISLSETIRIERRGFLITCSNNFGVLCVAFIGSLLFFSVDVLINYSVNDPNIVSNSLLQISLVWLSMLSFFSLQPPIFCIFLIMAIEASWIEKIPVRQKRRSRIAIVTFAFITISTTINATIRVIDINLLKLQADSTILFKIITQSIDFILLSTLSAGLFFIACQIGIQFLFKHNANIRRTFLNERRRMAPILYFVPPSVDSLSSPKIGSLP